MRIDCLGFFSLFIVSPKASEDAIVANSPSLAMGLLMPEPVNYVDCFSVQQASLSSSPFVRSLSNVAPFIFDDEVGKAWDFEYQSATTQTSYWPKKITDEDFFKFQLEQELANIDALCNGL